MSTHLPFNVHRFDDEIDLRVGDKVKVHWEDGKVTYHDLASIGGNSLGEEYILIVDHRGRLNTSIAWVQVLWRDPPKHLDAADLDRLPQRTIVTDKNGDRWQRSGRYWWPMTDTHMSAEGLVNLLGPITRGES